MSDITPHSLLQRILQLIADAQERSVNFERVLL